MGRLAHWEIIPLLRLALCGNSSFLVWDFGISLPIDTSFYWRILKKWRQLVLLMLIGAVLLTVLGGVKSYQAAEDAKVKREEQIAAGGPAEGEKRS